MPEIKLNIELVNQCVLHSALPTETASSDGLGRRRHNRELLHKSPRLVHVSLFVRCIKTYTNLILGQYLLIFFSSFYIIVDFAFGQSFSKVFLTD